MTPPTVRSSAAHEAREPGGSSTRAWTMRLLVLGIVLSALNLRPAITSLGALLEEVRDGLGMSGSVAGLLTSVPPLCFAVFGVMAPRLARRFGAGAVVCAGMAAIATGLAIRPYAGGTAGFLAASALALMGIAVSNVLMPVIVKHWFPDRVGSMTGLYSMALALGTALAAAVTVPLTDTLGGSWQSGLALWAGLAVAAVLPWLPFVRGLRRRPGRGSGAETGPRLPGVPWRRRRPPTGRNPGARKPLPLPRRDTRARRPLPPLRRHPRAKRLRGCGSPGAAPPGPWPSSSGSRRPPPTSPWAGWRRSSGTPACPRAPRGCCSRSPW
ncbi:hypothetical protein STAFG_5252 [Streptomyces afghaniensis 772]|uniref:Major facilitator superfamily (MFS) profile domain-containing protein n=1 Tax=Streptomyces afghaniensis 772 TaxID=1283301 RepID=S4MM60_9ACTN|nr:hypothetical protein STAFG_5252 [Streptomyces afghaniensis 772]